MLRFVRMRVPGCALDGLPQADLSPVHGSFPRNVYTEGEASGCGKPAPASALTMVHAACGTLCGFFGGFVPALLGGFPLCSSRLPTGLKAARSLVQIPACARWMWGNECGIAPAS